MFTPHHVAGKPENGIVLNKIRVTRGKFVTSGKGFEVIDDYTVPASANRLLPGAWFGTTEFREVDQQIINIHDDQQFDVGTNAAATIDSIGNSQKLGGEIKSKGMIVSLADAALPPRLAEHCLLEPTGHTSRGESAT